MKHKSLKRILIFAMFFVFTLIVANVKNVRAADDITIIPNGNGQYTITGTGAVTKAVIETRFENKESVKHIIVEEGITEIRDTSFADFSNLETVEIRANITVLEGYIFSGCEKLTTVILPDSIEEIEYGAFSDCSNLQTFTVGPNVKKIGNYAFENCIKLIKFEMGTSVTTLGEKVFYECKNLEEVEVPYTVTEIGSDAFSSCNGIKIICLQGSYAEEYAKNNNLEYEYIEDFELSQKEIIYDLTKQVDPVNLFAVDITEEIYWYAYDSEIVKLENGVNHIKVTGLTKGETVIKALLPDGRSATCKVKVVKSPVEMSFRSSEINLDKGNTYGIVNVVYNPTDANYMTDLTWSSTNENIASVQYLGSNNWLIEAQNVGSAVMTATTANGLQASCTVNVEEVENEAKINLSTDAITYDLGSENNSNKLSISTSTNEDTNVTIADDSIAELKIVEGGVEVVGKKVGQTTIIVQGRESEVTETCIVTVVQSPTEIVLSSTELTMSMKENSMSRQRMLSATLLPASTNYNKTLKITSSDTSVVTAALAYTNAWRIVGLKEGTATLTVTSENGIEATCTVTINSVDEDTTIEFIENEELVDGKLIYDINRITNGKILTINTDAEMVTWKSSNENVIKIAENTNKNARIVALNTGIAIIYVTTPSGNVATCAINVVKSPLAVVLDKNVINMSMQTNAMHRNTSLTASIIPSDANYNIDVQWESADENIASFALMTSNSIVVYGKQAGETYITAKTADNLEAKCKVVITDENAEETNKWDFSVNGDQSIIATLDENGVLTVEGNGIIKDNAFLEEGIAREEIKKIIIGEGITKIGANAFEDAGATSVEIPKTVTEIGDEAFKGSKLESVVIPSSVENIGKNAFYNCGDLKEVEILNSSTKIQEGAFEECSSGLIITGYAGSTAQKYAQENNIQFKVINSQSGDIDDSSDDTQGDNNNSNDNNQNGNTDNSGNGNENGSLDDSEDDGESGNTDDSENDSENGNVTNQDNENGTIKDSEDENNTNDDDKTSNNSQNVSDTEESNTIGVNSSVSNSMLPDAGNNKIILVLIGIGLVASITLYKKFRNA